ncbi:hypothetical protein CFE70_009536 [Pyrenophora teres f. teres 0-1]|uniref:Uncharacterized protein n=1 Tax=Pyrenophora teres f. teres (strain 0-1) TaxID=861557 RepID=E3S9W1_PYRTT|nr:hypothetical protein PTT_19855 [Pyrenophora teres f. teres 0-1]KAE8825050.1 hypothetical protein HRS9122_10149 [Pyrenophora teres f. teres]
MTPPLDPLSGFNADIISLESNLRGIIGYFKEIDATPDHGQNINLIIAKVPQIILDIEKHYDNLRRSLLDEAAFAQEHGADAVKNSKALLQELWRLMIRARAMLASANHTAMQQIYTQDSMLLPIPQELESEPACAEFLGHYRIFKGHLIQLHSGEAAAVQQTVDAYRDSIKAGKSDMEAQVVGAEMGKMYTQQLMAGTFADAQLAWEALEQSQAEFFTAVEREGGGGMDEEVVSGMRNLIKDGKEIFKRYEATVGLAGMERPL